jgi:hypothetical protein
MKIETCKRPDQMPSPQPPLPPERRLDSYRLNWMFFARYSR